MNDQEKPADAPEDPNLPLWPYLRLRGVPDDCPVQQMHKHNTEWKAWLSLSGGDWKREFFYFFNERAAGRIVTLKEIYGILGEFARSKE